MNDKLDTKKFLKKLIEQDGFGSVAGTLGEVAKEQETLIRNRNDSNLLCAFQFTFCALMECYKGAGKKNKKWIKTLLNVDPIKYSLDLSNCLADGQMPALKDAYKLSQEILNEP